MTTLACCLAAVWPIDRDVLLAECDPSGGDLACRFGLSARSGMASLVLALRQTSTNSPDPSPHVQHLPGGLEVLVGPTANDSAAALDHEMASIPGALLPVGIDAVVDCGRIAFGARGQHRMLEGADHLLLVTRTDASSIFHARSAIERLMGFGHVDAISVVLEGEGQHSVEETSIFVGAEVKGVVPYDPQSAVAACGMPGKARRFARSPLIASARRIVERVLFEGCPELGLPRAPGLETSTNDVAPVTDLLGADEVTRIGITSHHVPSGHSRERIGDTHYVDTGNR